MKNNQDEFTIKLNKAIKKSGMKKKYIAEQMGWSQTQYCNRITHLKLTISEREEIARIIRCEYVTYAVDEDNHKIYGQTGSELIKNALQAKGMTQTILAEKLNLTRQGVSIRLKQGKLSNDDIKNYLEIIGFKYVFYFEFPDGEKI